ncbi:MAG TPA: serine/threonine-protein kinase [Kofleriaceae bacterium]|nr:serine/threonine-protein kinase [Kofleriaceae bacterium]
MAPPVLATPTPAPVTPGLTTDSPASPSTSYLPPADDPLLGQILAGRYLIQKKLGEGGMGTVYLATHNILEKQVALKVLHGEFARKPELVERFMQEAKAASRIRHENVIDISDFGTTSDGMVFFAMELLEGHDLHEEIARARLANQLLPWERSKRIFLQLSAALSAAHAIGIIHRDLKPENIYLVEFLGKPDFVKLLDFGIAKQTELSEGDRKLTRTGMLFGTPEYMSPEQARGEAVDHRVDVYAMGCILFQLVTGKVPFEADNFMGVLTMHLTEPPPVIPPEVLDSIGAPRVLAEVIRQAMAKDRNQRFATVDDLAHAVRHASGDKRIAPVVVEDSVPAPPALASIGRVKTQWTGSPSISAIDALPPSRSRLPILLGAVVLLGGAAAVAGYLMTRGGDEPSGRGLFAGSPTQGSSVASVPSTSPVTPAGPAAVPDAPAAVPDAPPAPPVAPPASPVVSPPVTVEPLAFEWAQIRLDSTPPGADVKDLTNGTLIGRTPFTFKVRPSRNARQFGLHRKNYLDAVVELIPDRQKIEYTEKLVRGPSGRPTVVRPVIPPKTNSDSPPPPVDPASPKAGPSPPPVDPASPKADPSPPKADPSPTPEPPPPAVKPPKPSDEDCEPPCLKADPSRTENAGQRAP